MANEPKARKILSEGAGQYASLFLVFVMAAMLCGTVLSLSRVVYRADLQTIDRLYESRSWIYWTEEGLNRLNPSKLLDYHQKHEIPRRWWAWDYTLSWLVEPNHVPVQHNIVLFNHQLEDEPPPEAVKEFPWMKPLLHFPFPRAELAHTIEFLAKSGARLIILDNDFPQYSNEDSILAAAIHQCSSGKLTGKKVPVLMASTVNRRSFVNILQLDAVSKPSGVLEELQKLEPGEDVLGKYTGTTSMLLDEDQVVRRVVCSAADLNSKERTSIPVKALQELREAIPDDLPREMDIDFAGPPGSDLYPVRPFHYLLDPQIKQKIGSKQGEQSDDVKLDGAIVILGDSVTDVYPTPYTNLGVNLMSGAEIIAQAIDTISRHSWHQRLNMGASLVYIACCSVFGGLFLCLAKRLFAKNRRLSRNILARPFLDVVCCALSISLLYLFACIAFTYALLIVPVIVPAISLMVASLTTALWERENEHARFLQEQLTHAEDKLVLQAEKHDEELRRQAAEAQMQEVMIDEKRRQEFIRRINHDLKAPVTVMSWILAKLKTPGLKPEVVTEKIEKLAKTSNRLVDLLHELASSYETSTREKEGHVVVPEPCQLNKIISDCVSMAKPLAEMKDDDMEMTLPDRILWVNSPPLKLSRILDNLIRNAIIHNPPGTQIHVEARSSAHVHQVFVSDNGKGIPDDKLATLFEFKENDDRRSSMGDGLGLQIASAFIESVGGKVSVSSKIGAGTTFTVTLPSSHLEAGGDSGEDILSLGQLRVARLVQSAAVGSEAVAANMQDRGPDHD